jgi:hypothetical protein
MTLLALKTLVSEYIGQAHDLDAIPDGQLRRPA